MTDTELKFLTQNLRELFVRNDFDTLAGLFAMPLPFYANGELTLLRERDEIDKAFGEYHRRVKNAGITRIEPHNIVIEDTTDTRTMFRMQWIHHYADDKAPLVSAVRYVFKHGTIIGKVKVELVEYLGVSFPEIFPLRRMP